MYRQKVVDRAGWLRDIAADPKLDEALRTSVFKELYEKVKSYSNPDEIPAETWKEFEDQSEGILFETYPIASEMKLRRDQAAQAH